MKKYDLDNNFFYKVIVFFYIVIIFAIYELKFNIDKSK